jgi:hypothetical protein
MSRRVSLLGVLLLVTVFSSVCFAKFTVYLTDGTSHGVSKIYFNGDKADLYLASGQKLRVSAAGIDFVKSGFRRPEAAIATVYGAGTEAPSPGTKTPSQAEMESIWNQSHQNVVAVNDFGSISKGQIVRVVESSPLTTVVIEKDETTGIFKRIVLDTGSFADNFQPQAPAHGQPKSTAQSSEPPPQQPGNESDLTFYEPEGNASSSEVSEVNPPNAALIKIAAGIGVAVIVCIVLLIKTRGILRLGILVVFVAGSAFAANSGYHEWQQFKKVDEAEGRVKTFFNNLLDLTNEERVRTAAAVWSRGTMTIKNPTESAAAKSECFRWLEKGRIGIIKSFKIEGATLQVNASDVIVFVSVDDQLKKVLVSDGQSLSWAKREEQ